MSFRFDNQGASRFGQATQQNVGRLFAIILDNQVISAPQIASRSSAVRGRSPQLQCPERQRPRRSLRAGALPADLTIIEERTVGPSLGADSIAAGQFASIIAAVLVIGSMFFAYGVLGLLANIALIANVAMIIAILSVLGATLTLPGIAGIVLTMGMAVDSNVIIFERVREERRQGRSLVQSLDAGFQRALATVVDANLTTLIAAAMMFYLGSGPVRGFAITLGIGIITTVFTAYTLTRWMIALWLRRAKPKNFPVGAVNYIPFDTKIGFMRLRNFAFTLSAVTSIASAVLFFSVDMNYGIDFRAARPSRSWQRTEAPTPAMSASDCPGSTSAKSRSRNSAVRRTADPHRHAGRRRQRRTVRAAERPERTGRRLRLQAVEVVGPTVSSELAWAGTIAVAAAMLGMLVYIWLRFEWQFALGAVVTTLHDVILMVGLFVIAQIEFNLTSIAAILTIVGYSINDTVVIYDRVRENLRRYKRMPLIELLDLSMNQTLSRTILTGVTTLLALVALYCSAARSSRPSRSP